MGTLTAGKEWFKRWRTISGDKEADPGLTELQVMLEGVCEHRRFLDLVRDFIVYEDDGSGELVKKMAGITSSTRSRRPSRKHCGRPNCNAKLWIQAGKLVEK